MLGVHDWLANTLGVHGWLANMLGVHSWWANLLGVDGWWANMLGVHGWLADRLGVYDWLANILGVHGWLANMLDCKSSGQGLTPEHNRVKDHFSPLLSLHSPRLVSAILVFLYCWCIYICYLNQT